MKVCTVCKEEKPYEDYYNSKATKDGKCYRCKKCDWSEQKEYRKRHNERWLELSRVANRRRKYGLSPEDFESLLSGQGGLCASCGVILTEEGGTKQRADKLVVDHCHETGKVRGLLCTKCNKGIGLLGDNVEGLQRALSYLSKEDI